MTETVLFILSFLDSVGLGYIFHQTGNPLLFLPLVWVFVTKVEVIPGHKDITQFHKIFLEIAHTWNMAAILEGKPIAREKVEMAHLEKKWDTPKSPYPWGTNSSPVNASSQSIGNDPLQNASWILNAANEI